MAVYTPLDDTNLTAWLDGHDVGVLQSWQGIASGIENSNFFVTTVDRGVTRRFVLTVFERLACTDLAFYLPLMQHLASRGVPCPAPIPDRRGALASDLLGKPAALVTRLAGHTASTPGAAHCGAIGDALARLHLAGADFDRPVQNPRGIDWWREAAGRLRELLDADRRALLDDEIAHQSSSWAALATGLPRGPIHADLFRDNALFEDGADAAATTGSSVRLSGLIDFYFAGEDPWVLDLAICANDWCVEAADGRFDTARLDALVAAYARVRPLGDDERAAWPSMLRGAALRFWLSRLDDLHRPRPAQLLQPHDPTHFERILRARRRDAGVVDGHGRAFAARD